MRSYYCKGIRAPGVPRRGRLTVRVLLWLLEPLFLLATGLVATILDGYGVATCTS